VNIISNLNLECKVKINKIIYPRGLAQAGDWGIVVLSIVEVIAGEPILEDFSDTFVAKGILPDVSYTETFKFIGKLINDSKYGKQYEIISLGTDYNLSDENDQRIFLSHILSDRQLQSLYETYESPFDVIDREDIELLCKVNGIGVFTAEKIIQKYKDTIDYSGILVELDGFGLTKNMIKKLLEKYKTPDIVINKVKNDPYILADEVDGIGWKKADAIAMKTGFDRLSKPRIRAFLSYHFEQEAQKGNSWLYPSDVLYAVEEMLSNEDIDQEYFKEILHEMYNEEILYWDDSKSFIALKKYYDLECNIKDDLLRLLSSEKEFECDNVDTKIKDIEREQGFQFDESQIEAIKKGLKQNVIVFTGSAGTGKTSIVNAIISLLKSNYSFAQTALSGKAASRMEEVTGEKGYTVHKLLGYAPREGFTYDKDYPMDHDIIILDETSMVGGELFYSLIQAIKDGAKFIMVGDFYQLESIGTMNILKDLLDSEVVPSAKLTKIHRQAAKSGIITDSLKVKDGEQLVGNGWNGVETRGELQDFVIDVYDDKILTAPKIIEWVKKEYEKRPNIMDIQVLVPIKEKGDACTFELNNQLQEIFNPYNKNLNEIEVKKYNKSYVLRENDKVINMINCYKTVNMDGANEPIFNGYVGIIKQINYSNMVIDFSICGEVIVEKELFRNIELGYACTIHKYQGSQSPVVIFGIDYSSYVMLNKEMIYTGISRASKKCILCAEESALRYAISNSNISIKQTFLPTLLKIQ